MPLIAFAWRMGPFRRGLQFATNSSRVRAWFGETRALCVVRSRWLCRDALRRFRGQRAGATVLYVHYAGSQLKIMAVQLQHMQSQTRPWVGLDADNMVQADPLAIDANGNIRATCTMKVRNYGTYPAQHVLLSCEIMVLQGSIVRVQDRINDLCHERVPTFAGSVLFQGHTDTWRWDASVPKSQSLRDPGGGPFYVFLIGCINYRDQFDVGHCTAFSFKRNFKGTINTISFDPLPNTVIQGEWVRSEGLVDPR